MMVVLVLQSIMLLVVLPMAIGQLCAKGLKEAKSVLEYHNNLRSSLSSGQLVVLGRTMPPAATPIPNLTWDCELEQSAKRVADRCLFQHSQIANVGENLYKAWSSAKISPSGLALNASQAWANEFDQFGWSSTTLTMTLFNSGVGHATQMVWADSTKIGCSSASCEQGNAVIVACHYTKQGNVLGEKIYDAAY